jgi:double-stranded uracil-DNA glycosylase
MKRIDRLPGGLRPSAGSGVSGLPDILTVGLKVVFCGINPGMRSAQVGYHFANRSNRFWRAIYLAGFTAKELQPEEACELLDYGCGLTSAVQRPTVGAGDLSRADFIEARPKFEEKMREYRPRHLAFLGKPAYAAFLNERKLLWGRQAAPFGGATVWVLPNPSGLNFAFSLEMLTSAYKELAGASGFR